MQEEFLNKETSAKEDVLCSTKENQNNKNKYKSLTFWLSAVAVLIVVAQIILNFFWREF